MESFSLNPNPLSSALLRNDRSAPMAYSCADVFNVERAKKMITGARTTRRLKFVYYMTFIFILQIYPFLIKIA